MNTYYLRNFGIRPNSDNDIVPILKSVLELAHHNNKPCEIVLENGTYNAYLTDLAELDIHVSNTISDCEYRENGEIVSIKRKSPFILKNMSDITIDGCGSLIKCHGKMTQIILECCKNIIFKNLIFDYVNPTVTEMMVISCGRNYLDCVIPAFCPYKITDKKLIWYGENFSFSKGISQIFNPKTGFTWRFFSPLEDENAYYEEMERGLIRLYFNSHTGINNPYGAKTGYIFQMRDPIRDECGIIVSNCINTSFINVTMHFMSGLGFIAQNSENIYLNGFKVFPPGGRTVSCAADFMHFSGCRGKIKIQNGYFIGAHDDAINVHGTHLKIIETDHISDKIKIRFMHPQTYGICGFTEGDEIGSIDPETLHEIATTKIKQVYEINPYEMILKLDSSEGFEPGKMVENITANAEVIISNNHFERIPTRGILVTTRKSVVIENNEFVKVTGCGILIADDARSWYESGHVTDVIIKNNIYRSSSDSFVRIEPECSENNVEAVHSGIKIIDNVIELSDTNEVISAKNVEGLVFENNIIYGNFDASRSTLENVKNMTIRKNSFNGKEWYPQ